MNQTVPSTYQENDQYFLAVPNPFVSGEYTCAIAGSSPATLCIQSDSPLARGATVMVDGTEGRIALMASELQALKLHETSMAGKILSLQANNSQMAGEIQSLQASNSVLVTTVAGLQGRIDTLQADNTLLTAVIRAWQGRFVVLLCCRSFLNNNNRIQRRIPRFFVLQSPHCSTNRLQHIRSSGPGAIVCKSRATHRALITYNMSCYVPHGTRGQFSY